MGSRTHLDAGDSGICRMLKMLGLALGGSLCFVALTIQMVSAGENQDILAVGYGKLNFDAPEAGSYKLPPVEKAADGTVLLSSGEPAQLHDLYQDRIVLLSFIYSSCNDVNGCPLATAVLHRLKARLDKDPALAGSVRLLSLSFDPERDTPEVMRLYGSTAAKKGTDWQYLTAGSFEQLKPILAAYDQSIQRDYNEKGEYTGTISHVLRVFLIGKDKAIRNIYSVSFLHPDVLLADIRTLLMESQESARTVARQAMPDAGKLASARLEAVASPPLGLPPVPVPKRSPIDENLIKLGERLFFERNLSANGSLACAHCHIPDQGFTNNMMQRPVGIEGNGLRRNAATLYNVGYLKRLFLDGREFELENAVWDELLDYGKTGNRDAGGILARLNDADDYRELFAGSFADKSISMENVATALAAYMRTLVSGGSAFDRWYYGKQAKAIGESARRGFALFTGKADCASCHTVAEKHALFTDNKLHNTGLGWHRSMNGSEEADQVELAPGVVVQVNREALSGTEERRFNDLGLYEVTQKPEDRWAFRTPSLRNIALTAPYMHDGSFSSLEAVVEFYNRGGYPNELLDERIRPLGLDKQERQDLVEFLKTLTGNGVENLATRLTSDAYSRELGRFSTRSK